MRWLAFILGLNKAVIIWTLPGAELVETEWLFVVHPGKDSYVMNDQTEAVAITNLRARLSQADVGCGQ